MVSSGHDDETDDAREHAEEAQRGEPAASSVAWRRPQRPAPLAPGGSGLPAGLLRARTRPPGARHRHLALLRDLALLRHRHRSRAPTAGHRRSRREGSCHRDPTDGSRRAARCATGSGQPGPPRLDPLVGRRQRHADVPRPRGAVEVAGRDEDAPLGEASRRFPAGLVPGRPQVEPGLGVVDPEAGAPPAPAAARSRRARVRSRCSATCASSPSAGDHRRLHGPRDDHPGVLADLEQLAHQRGVTRDEARPGSRRGWTAWTASAPRAARRASRRTRRVQHARPAARPSPARRSTRRDATTAPCSRAQATTFAQVLGAEHRDRSGCDGRVEPDQARPGCRARAAAARRPRTAVAPASRAPTSYVG